jgi:hypothetical protein
VPLVSDKPTIGEQKANVKYLFGNFASLFAISFRLPLLHLFRMASARTRSAGVTAAATYALLCCATVFVLWGVVFRRVLNIHDDHGRAYYELFPGTFAMAALLPPAIVAVGVRTAIGLLQLRPWARLLSMAWAAICLMLCLALIALRPFETFVIPHHFVTELTLARQMVAVSFVFMLLPVSVWWLFYFRTQNVKLQFEEPGAGEDAPIAAGSEKN